MGHGYLIADVIQIIYTLKPELLNTLTFAIVERMEGQKLVFRNKDKKGKERISPKLKGGKQEKKKDQMKRFEQEAKTKKPRTIKKNKNDLRKQSNMKSEGRKK